MSLKTPLSQAATPSVYQHLLRLYEGAEPNLQEESLITLNENFRQKIFYHIWESSGKPAELDFGKVHIFDSLPQLQQAIKQIVSEIFNSSKQDFKDKIASRVWELNHSPSAGDSSMKINYALQNTPALLNALHNSLGDLTPELKKILDQWAPPSHQHTQKERAKNIIYNFLKDNRKTELNFAQLGLTTLPPIFNQYPFTSRLNTLDLSWNQFESLPLEFAQLKKLTHLKLNNNLFTSIPKGICQLESLTYLEIQSNSKLKWLPPEIGQLKKLTHLKINSNKLESIPPEIGQLESLIHLNFSSNEITSLPPEIGKLKKLVHLELFYNQLTLLPKEIGQLESLTYLNIRYNKLKSIPEQIGHLDALLHLDLGENQIESIPKQVGELKALVCFYLGVNKLKSLPKEIGALQNLTILMLFKNCLESLPEEIGQLQNLTQLSFSNNPNLRTLPNRLLNLPQGCVVNIVGIRLSQNVLQNLERACHDPNYQGPRFSFSMSCSVNLNMKSLPALIKELIFASGDMPTAFPTLDMVSPEQKTLVQMWLNRISGTADYQRDGEIQKALAKQILTFLIKAENDDQFSEAFLNIIEGSSGTCGDRISLSLLHIGITAELRQIKDINRLQDYLVGTVWPIELLEKIARKKVKTLIFFDEIEVYLGYPIMLREELKLEINIQNMLYFRYSRLTKEDLNEAAEFVRTKQQNETALCAFLSEHVEWKKALQKQYPDRCKEIDDEGYNELENAGKDPDKLVQLGINQKDRWEGLTAWALAERSHKRMRRGL